jgi:hypothetical protein
MLLLDWELLKDFLDGGARPVSGNNIRVRPWSRSCGSANRPFELSLIEVVPWIATGFLVSLAIAAVTVAVAGVGEHGTVLALRTTARWCFLLFWLAYAGGGLTMYGGQRFAILARRGREFGLAFAAALLVHVGLVLWLMAAAADQRSPMLIFWGGVVCTYALALSSLPPLRSWLGPRLWRISCEGAMHYIGLVFAVDFIVEPLMANGLDEYPLTYLPFVIMLLGGSCLRFAAHHRRQRTAEKA